MYLIVSYLPRAPADRLGNPATPSRTASTMKGYQLIPALAFFFAACGGGDAPDAGASTSQPAAAAAAPAAQPAANTGAMPAAPTGAMTIPDWYSVDNDARTVNMTITAGATPDNNYWNFNGAIKGALAITVPEGYTITIELVNQDPNMVHSVGIQRDFTNPMLPPTPDPVFEGAVTPNPQSMIDGTMPGQSATIQFVADAAGNYAMICYTPGHTALGMWLYFNVADGGEAGVQGL